MTLEIFTTIKMSKKLKMETVCSYKMLVSTYVSKWCYSPEDRHRKKREYFRFIWKSGQQQPQSSSGVEHRGAASSIREWEHATGKKAIKGRGKSQLLLASLPQSDSTFCAIPIWFFVNNEEGQAVGRISLHLTPRPVVKRQLNASLRFANLIR